MYMEPFHSMARIRQIIMLGPGTMLAKIDIQSAFRLIPVHPVDCHLASSTECTTWSKGSLVSHRLRFFLLGGISLRRASSFWVGVP